MTEAGMIPDPSVWRRQLLKKHWKKNNSAWAVAHSWFYAQDLPPEIRGVFGNDAMLLRMEPEGAVALPGSGRPGSCDVFACVEFYGKEYVLVVEAKVEEEFGQTVRRWLDSSTSEESAENRQYRLEMICKKLGLDYNFVIDLDVGYELFHKVFAALKSAEFWDADGALMIVQSFSTHCTGFDEFKRFCGVFAEIHHFPDGLYEESNDISKVTSKSIAPDLLYKVETPSDTPLFLGWVTCEMPEEE